MIKPFDFVWTMDISTEESLPAVCVGLGVIEYETNIILKLVVGMED